MRFSLGWFARGREEVIDEQAGRRGIVGEARHERGKIMKISRWLMPSTALLESASDRNMQGGVGAAIFDENAPSCIE